jgi:hypothetical protein
MHYRGRYKHKIKISDPQTPLRGGTVSSELIRKPIYSKNIFRKNISLLSLSLRCSKFLADVKSRIVSKLECKLHKLNVSHKSSLNANSQLLTSSARITFVFYVQ